jgi:hypothetical protein
MPRLAIISAAPSVVGYYHVPTTINHGADKTVSLPIHFVQPRRRSPVRSHRPKTEFILSNPDSWWPDIRFLKESSVIIIITNSNISFEYSSTGTSIHPRGLIILGVCNVL